MASILIKNGLLINENQQYLADIYVEDGFIAADAINFVTEDDKTQVGIEIHSGKNRIVRRMFEHLGYDVVKESQLIQ